MARYLGIDYGLERVGLAVSDPEGRQAFPLLTLRLKDCGSRKAMLDKLADIIRANGIDAIVIGLPLHGDGGENMTCRQIRNMAARLERRSGLAAHFCNEYLSSQAAEDDLRQAGLRGRKLREVLDQRAACLILESFINQQASRRQA